ncbi:hypothetical protein BV22DRAFT_1051584 [Leucogyrophana mollusca]|uniref:Uncharacterized protein n=1 Tax=Leucogyrophana mollusca TaxID=85980 RepID=A0ACB8B0A7_9AGAM|nr:hypothetical protein BV22DRAFT_1051584 [Leucogyrophana mollusca]
MDELKGAVDAELEGAINDPGPVRNSVPGGLARLPKPAAMAIAAAFCELGFLPVEELLVDWDQELPDDVRGMLKHYGSILKIGPMTPINDLRRVHELLMSVERILTASQRQFDWWYLMGKTSIVDGGCPFPGDADAQKGHHAHFHRSQVFEAMLATTAGSPFGMGIIEM